MIYRNLLLIEDDEDDVEIFMTAFENLSAGIRCVSVNSARTALQQLLNNELNPDIIFLDLNMPMMNGYQFLEEIKKNTSLSEIPVVIFSTSSHDATIKLAKDAGAAYFITKPDKYDDLFRILRSFFRG